VLKRAYCTPLTVYTSGLDTEDARIFAADLINAFSVILRINNELAFTKDTRSVLWEGETEVFDTIKDTSKLLPAN
jgi:hypothetical protein